MSYSLKAKRKILELDMEFDPEESERKQVCFCKSCFYKKPIGQDVLTTSNCQSCGSKLVFGSSIIDKFCLSCAKIRTMCKRCGKSLDE